MDYENQEIREGQGSTPSIQHQDPIHQPNSITSDPSSGLNQDDRITNNDVEDEMEVENDKVSAQTDTMNQRQGGDFDDELEADENLDERDIARD